MESGVICRICLNPTTYNYSCKRIDYVLIEKLKYVISEQMFHSTNYFICDNCNKHVGNMYELKYQVNKSSRSVKKECETDFQDIFLHNSSNSTKNELTCKICMSFDEYLCPLETIGQVIRQMFPELDIAYNQIHKICHKCIDNIYQLLHFKLECLKIESIIEEFCYLYKLQIDSILNLQEVMYYAKSKKDYEINSLNRYTALAKSPESELESNYIPLQNKEKINYKIFIQDTIKTEIKPIKRSGIYLFMCPKCTRIFKNITEHFKEHPELLPLILYSCPQCDFQHMIFEELSKHQCLSKSLSHTQEMFSCPYCPHKTKQKGNLVIHMNLHKDPEEVLLHKCHLCKYKTRQKGNLQTHLLVHKSPEEILMYRCNHCKYQTRQKGNLLTHMLRKHRNLSEKELEDALFYKCKTCLYKTKRKKIFQEHVCTNPFLLQK